MKEEERGKGREGNHNFLEIARGDRIESYTILIANPLSKGRKGGRGKRRGKKGQSWTSAMETAAATSPTPSSLSLFLSLSSFRLSSPPIIVIVVVVVVVLLIVAASARAKKLSPGSPESRVSYAYTRGNNYREITDYPKEPTVNNYNFFWTRPRSGVE